MGSVVVKRRTETSEVEKTEIVGWERQIFGVRKREIFLIIWVIFPLPPIRIGL